MVKLIIRVVILLATAGVIAAIWTWDDQLFKTGYPIVVIFFGFLLSELFRDEKSPKKEPEQQ